MRITILGSGTGVPSADRGAAGIVVAAGDELALVDGGSGTLVSLSRLGLDYRRVGAFLFTHSHADHTLDLVSLLHALNYTPGYVHQRTLRVIGPPGFSGFLERLLEAYPSVRARTFELELTEADDGDVVDLGWARVTAARVPHGDVRANAYRISSGGGEVVFSGDCSPSLRLADLARGCDLLISEASFAHATAESGPHMTAGEAGHLAQAAGLGALVLTHFYPGASEQDLVDACAREYGGRLIVAYDSMALAVEEGEVSIVDGSPSWDAGRGLATDPQPPQ